MKAELEFEKPPPERLSITHLLVWTAMSAVLLGYQRAMTSFAEGQQTQFSTIVTLFYAPLFGAGLGACVLCFWRRTNGGPRFPVQPGHWLLIISGIGGLISLVFQTLSVLALAGATTFTMFIAIRLVEFLAHFVLFGIAAWRIQGAWRGVMLLGVLQSVAMTFLCIWVLFGIDDFFFGHFQQAELVLRLLVSAAVLVMAIVDVARREPRDYLHWTGIAARLTHSALIVAIPYLFRWLQKPPG